MLCFFTETYSNGTTMAYQLGMDKALSIKTLRESGLSERAISESLGVSRNAVRRHLSVKSSNDTKALPGSAPTGSEVPNDTKAPTGSGEVREATVAPLSRSRCERFRELILSKLEQGLDSRRIYQDLVEEHGFDEKYWSVRRFVKSLGVSSALPFRRIEVEPGWELQVDFGAGRPCQDHTGAFRKTYVFRAVLSHSRKGYTEAVTRLTTESFIRSLENAFWRLGGVPKTVVFDNAKCVVLKADWYDPALHPKIVEFCKHYGFAMLPTRPATPRHKGKVERGVDYVQENALKGRTFESLAQQNAHLDHWEKTVADTRIHGTTKKHVGVAFESTEKPCLQPLPTERFPYYEEGQRKVSRDGHVSVNHAYYSAPAEYLGHDVWIRWNSQTVRILNHRMESIAVHCTQAAGRFSTLGEHIHPLKSHMIERGIEYNLRKVRLLGPQATRWAEAMIEARGIPAARVLQGLLSLSQKYKSEQIERACETAWRSQAYDYRTVKRLLEHRTAAQQQTMEFMDDHPIIRSVAEYGDFIRNAIQGEHSNV
jgi:transposase